MEIKTPYRTIDLCPGIGGIRRGFELTGQFGNSVTIPVIEEMARFMLDCLTILHEEEP